MKQWIKNKIMGDKSPLTARDKKSSPAEYPIDERPSYHKADSKVADVGGGGAAVSIEKKSSLADNPAEEQPNYNKACIKVVGVGGGGGNAINTMIAAGIKGVEFIAANTDLQALNANLAPTKIQLGDRLTKGLGAGAKPQIGRDAAQEDAERLRKILNGADMVFVTAGMGGGTGTGGAPVISAVAREIGALTVGVVTKPFAFEGRRRMQQAIDGIDELTSAVDTLITIPNERLLSVAGEGATAMDAFTLADNVLLNAVRGISDLVVVSGFINVDFADVKSVMQNMGKALMSTGQASGEDRAVKAARQAISSPLLEDQSIDGATGILINITGGHQLTLAEISKAAALIHEAADPDANIIFGSVIDPTLGDEVRITVIGTGVNLGKGKGHPLQPQSDSSGVAGKEAPVRAEEAKKKQPRTIRAISPEKPAAKEGEKSQA